MRLPLLVSTLMLCLTYSYGQSLKTDVNDDELNLKKLLLISELRPLEARSAKIEGRLGRALAESEIAEAAWTLDTTWAKKLLREAYAFTFPEEEERSKLAKRAVGAAPTIPTTDQIDRNIVREKILEVAARDKFFTEELIQLGAQQLGKLEQHYNYADLATMSVEAGDNKAAGEYVLKAIQSEPSILNAGFVIFDIAVRDRAAADNLIIQYMELLQSVPLSSADGSALRTYLFLRDLAFNNSQIYLAMLGKNDDPRYQKIPPPGPAVLKAYAYYVVESLVSLEEREPGSAVRFRGFLLSAFAPLQQFAPELTGLFSQLERLSRKPGDTSPILAQTNIEQTYDDKYRRRVKDALDSDNPDDLTINLAISRGDFDNARKLINKLDDGPQKTQLLDAVNMHEALRLTAQDKIVEAEIMARQLTRATSMTRVYPTIIAKCSQRKDEACATGLVYEAIKQLKRADTAPTIPPVGLSSPISSKSRESDAMVLSFAQLSQAVASINEALALDILDEMVIVANQRQTDTRPEPLIFESRLFRKLAVKNETRVRQAAESFKDPLREILALAAVYQWKAEELAKKPKSPNQQRVKTPSQSSQKSQ